METKARLTSEQIEADNNLVNGLESSLKYWQKELLWVEQELIEQALIDAKQGDRSSRYTALEGREKILRRWIAEAQNKLGLVAERYNIGPLKNLLSTALKHVRP